VQARVACVSARKQIHRLFKDPEPLVLSVTILDSGSAIQNARNLWTHWPGTRDSDIDFFLYIAGVRPEVLQPYVLVSNRNGVPDAIMIGRLEERKASTRFGYFTIHSPNLRVLNFVYGALRGNADAENTDALLAYVLGMLKRGEIDLAVFEHLPVDSYLYEAVSSKPGTLERGFPAEHRTHRCLELPESSEALYKLLPPKHRQVYRGKGRKIVKDFNGDVHIKCYREVSELDQMFRDVEKIASKTYQRGLGFGFRDTPEMRGRCELAASRGWLRVHILYVAGKPSAYWNASAYCGTLWGDHIGFDPELGRYSPGMYLSLTVIGDLCDHKQDHGITQINFGPGDAEYKTILSNISFQEGMIQLYGHTWRGFSTKLLFTPIVLADRLAKRVLSNNKWLARAKRVWRDRAQKASAAETKAKSSQPTEASL
jgi:Acetyltransferase (GNAT) domain